MTKIDGERYEARKPITKSKRSARLVPQARNEGLRCGGSRSSYRREKETTRAITCARSRGNAFLRESRRRSIAIYDSSIDARALRARPEGIVGFVPTRRSRPDRSLWDRERGFAYQRSSSVDLPALLVFPFFSHNKKLSVLSDEVFGMCYVIQDDLGDMSKSFGHGYIYLCLVYCHIYLTNLFIITIIRFIFI